MDSNVPFSLGFTSQEREVTNQSLQITGHFPPWLGGSLLRTGPAKFEIGAQSYTHWFDGQAMLHAFEMRDGGVFYTNRFLRGKSFCDAEKKGRIVRGEFMTDPCRSLFGRVMAILFRRPTDNANVNIAVLGQQLVALTETPMPVRFDPHTLETLGRFHFEPRLKAQIATAHPHFDGERGYFYAIELGRKSAYQLHADEKGTQRLLVSVPVERPSYMHSFGMSERYLVLSEFPLKVNPLDLALSRAPFITNYRWQPEVGTLFTVVDKVTGRIVARAHAAPCFSFHHVNAFEEGDSLVVDLLAFPDASIIDSLRLARLRAAVPTKLDSTLTRFRIPIGRGGEAKPVDVVGETLCETALELPRIDYSRRAGKPYRCVWGTSQSAPETFMDTITKIELQGTGTAPTVTTWAEPGCFPGEPVFVPRPSGSDEDDGSLLSVVLDSRTQRSFLLVLDAATLSEVARAGLPHHIPFSFHGNHFSRTGS